MEDRHQEAAYVAKSIAAFLDGTSGEWDWDDFTSFRLRDPAVEGVRRRALAIDLPVDEKGEAALRDLQAEAECIAAHGG